MENNYKPNSFKYKEEQKEKEQEQRAQKVVSGKVTTVKKSGLKKFMNNVVNEDVPKVKEYIISDVLIPSIKKAISDIVRNGIDMFLYGADSGKNKNRTTASRVSYGGFYDSPRSTDRRYASTRSAYDFEDPLFETRGDAEIVLSQMDDIIERYRVVKISDLYDLAGISTYNYCLSNYGWTDLRSASVQRVSDGYVIKFPKAMPID